MMAKVLVLLTIIKRKNANFILWTKKSFFRKKVFDITDKSCYTIIVTNYGINYFFYNY